MPSAVGKRVGRVLAGCSKPEAGDKPGLYYLARILGFSRYLCIGQQDYPFETHPTSDVIQAYIHPESSDMNSLHTGSDISSTSRTLEII